jgi:hypothetical protein
MEKRAAPSRVADISRRMWLAPLDERPGSLFRLHNGRHSTGASMRDGKSAFKKRVELRAAHRAAFCRAPLAPAHTHVFGWPGSRAMRHRAQRLTFHGDNA